MSDTLISIENVSFAYDAATPVLREVTLAVRAGEFLALIGRNGSGKTTLAKHLNGLLKPSSGQVLVGDIDTRAVPVGELARQVGYVFQNPDHQLFLPTVRQEIAYGPSRLGLTGKALDERVAETLERFDLTGMQGRHPAVLGRGVRRLTALAAIYAMRPRVFVLDEPTGGLDRRFANRLMELLLGLANEGHAVILITHDMRLVADHARRVLLLRDGQVVADGTPVALFDQPELLATSGVQPPQVARLAQALRPHGLPGGICTVEGFCAEYVKRLEQPA
ncbi:MAG TPA: ATP-binding cassette domain-containing protein [Chloroflexota bacterium]|nr:ATP-binding cassette domain-containing protein [Chloroflexota bacterium]